MKVILEKDVRKVGDAGAVVAVADGYARNYLLPRGLAREATPAGVRAAEAAAAAGRRRTEREAVGSRALAERLAGVSLTIAVKAGEGEKVFGAVTSAEIAEALAAQGVEVDRRKIALDEPIRALGTHDVAVRLPGGVTATFRVSVVSAPV